MVGKAGNDGLKAPAYAVEEGLAAEVDWSSGTGKDIGEEVHAQVYIGRWRKPLKQVSGSDASDL